MNRKRVMYNDFILVGPKENPAGVSGDDVKAAFQKITEVKANFITRGDDSGTHKKELGIWTAANIKPAGDIIYLNGSRDGCKLYKLPMRKMDIF